MNEIKLSDLEKSIMKLSGNIVRDKTVGFALRNMFFNDLYDKNIVFEKIKGNSPALIKITKNGVDYLCTVATRDAGKTDQGFTVGTKSAEKEKYNNEYYVIFVDVDVENNSIKRSLIIESKEAYNKDIIKDNERKNGNTLTDTNVKNLDDYAGNNPNSNFEEWLEEV